MLVPLVAFVVLAALSLYLLVRLLHTERQLRALARYLSERDSLSNTRVTVSTHTRGFVLLGQAVNRLIDRQQGERIEGERRRQNLRRGLTCLSHDIRTPLAGAQGYAQLADEERDEERRSRYLGSVRRRLDDVGELLDQLYVYACMQDPDHRLEREQVDVSEALLESLASLYTLFKERSWEPSIRLEEEPLRCASNFNALKRIFRNLAMNALRHGSSPPRIVQSGRSLTLSNRLDDPGSLDADRLFERFYKGGDRGGEGGLGLAIVAQLAKALDVQVSAQIVDDELCIGLVFPDDQPQNPAPQDEAVF